MDLHKAELKEQKDGSLTLTAQLFGNAAQLKAIRAGAVTAVLVKEDPKNPEQLDVQVTITPAAKPVAKPAEAPKPAAVPAKTSEPHPLSK